MEDEKPVAEIKPDIAKSFLLNIATIMFIAASTIGIIFYMKAVVPVDAILVGFEKAGIDVPKISVFSIAMWAIIALGVVVTAYDFIKLKEVRFLFFKDHIEYSQPFAVMKRAGLAIPYSNIARVSCRSMFPASYAINLELTGMGKPYLEIGFIDKGQEYCRWIQEVVENFKATAYAKKTEEMRIGSIMDKEDKVIGKIYK